ncbi:MAG: DMT family transporter [Acidimicrobiia bacterium]|nr:DMT family transporter [Acidimicrobiia bacterium]
MPLLASLMALSSGIVWSFGAIAARKADESDAFQYLIWRSIAIIAVIEVAARLRRRRPLTSQAFGGGPTMLLACGCLLLASIAFVYAVKTTTPANAAFLASVTPLIAVLVAKVTLGEPLTPVTIVAVAVAFVGLLVTVFGDLKAGNLTGNIAALMSSVGFAGYAVCLRTDPRRDWSPVMPGYAVMMIVLCSVITLSTGTTLVPPARDIGYAAIHGGVFIVVGTLAFNVASRQIPAVAMSVLAQTEMLFVPIWAFIILSERPRPATLAGGAIILAAVVGKALLDAKAPAAPASIVATEHQRPL